MNLDNNQPLKIIEPITEELVCRVCTKSSLHDVYKNEHGDTFRTQCHSCGCEISYDEEGFANVEYGEDDEFYPSI